MESSRSSPPPMFELADAANALAAQANRRFVTPNDIKLAAPAVLRRMVPNADSVAAILENTPVP